jgi:Replication-relaxation
MPKGKSLTVTEEAAIGLFFIQRYRFLTIDQFARIAGLNRTTAAHQLRFFELAGMLGNFGNTARLGHGKTPKVYFLTRKGFGLLAAESLSGSAGECAHRDNQTHYCRQGESRGAVLHR